MWNKTRLPLIVVGSIVLATTIAVTLLIVSTPRSPERIQSTSDFDAIELAWQPVDGAEIYRVNVARDPGMRGLVETRDTTTPRTTIDELNNGSDYYVQVSAISNIGLESGQHSITRVSTPHRAVSAPTSVTTAALSTTSLAVTWDQVQWATAYRVNEIDRLGNTTSTQVSGTATQLVVDGLPETEIGIDYSFTVEALNGPNVSEPSPMVMQNTQAPPPYAVAVTTPSALGAVITWKPSVNAQRYVVETSRTPNFSDSLNTFDVPAPLTSLSLNNFAAGTAGYARVRTINGTETSSASEAIPIRPHSTATVGVNVGTFNILSIRYDTTTGAPWTSRRSKVATLINKAKLDVVGLQEATTNTLTRKSPTTQLSDLVTLTKPKLTESRAGFLGTRLLYNSKKLTAGDFGIIDLPQLEDDTPRAAIWQILIERKTGARFIALNTHLTNGVGDAQDDARAAQSATITAWLSENAPTLPVVLTGDFNSFATRASDSPMRILTDAGYPAAEYGAAERTNSSLSTLVNGDRAHVESPKLDHIHFSENIGIVSYEIVNNSKYESGSDHRLVTSRLRIPIN